MSEGIQFSRQGWRASGRRSGFTLLEILVVLVVLLIGIMAVLRLFPGGFLTIQRTNEATAAQALEAQMIEQQKNLDSVSESIVSVYFNRNRQPIPWRDVLPEDLRDLTLNDPLYQSIDTNDHPYFFSNINRINWIIGETFRLPVPTQNPANGAFGSAYILAQGPVRNYLGRDQLNDLSDSIEVYSMPMERIEQSSLPTVDRPDPTPILRNENQFAIDYERMRIAFFPRPQNLALRPLPNANKREFAITLEYYTIVSGSPVRHTMLRHAVTVIDAVQARPDESLRPIWQPIFNNPNDPEFPNDQRGASLPTDWTQGFSTIIRDTEDVSRNFRMLTDVQTQNSNAAPNWSPDDPYEYVWYSSQMTPNLQMNDKNYIPANPGILLFNPRGYNATIQTSRGPQPFRVRVDYAPFDNHIIREERTVPNQGPYVVRVSLPFILRTGDVLDDKTTYKGIFKWWTDIRNPDSVISSPDFMIYNASTGTEIARLENNTVTVGPGLTAPPNNQPAFILNEKGGQVRFNTAFIESNNLRSANIRVLYQAQKEWGMQLQKANNRYYLAEQPNTVNVNYRSYYVGGSYPPNGQPLGEWTRIYFPVSDAGKTVVLGEYFVTTNLRDAQNNPIIKRFSGESYRINDNSALFTNFSTQFRGGANMSWIDLKSRHPEAETEGWKLTASQTGVALSHVQGASMKARVIWRDGGRWRRRDTETLLVQPSLR